MECLFAFQDLNRQMKVLLNDFTSFLNKNANEDVFMNMEMQLKDAVSKKDYGIA